MKTVWGMIFVVITIVLLISAGWSNNSKAAPVESQKATVPSGYLTTKDGHLMPLPEMRFISGGEFPMGNPHDDKSSDEYHEDEAKRQVTVAPFYLSRFTVTNEAFCVFLNSNETFKNLKIENMEFENGQWSVMQYKERWPVRVSCRLAEVYCEWLSQGANTKFRLPTEAEWEFAARGEEGADWPWRGDAPQEAESEGAEILHVRGWRWLRTKNTLPYEEFPLASPIGMFPHGQTPDGVYGMMGSFVGEWCADQFHPSGPKDFFPTQDPSKMKVIRGAPYRRRTKRRVNWLLFPLIKDAAISTQYEAYIWTRIGGDERINSALIRLAMDAEPSNAVSLNP